ncbi:hypothetical protein J6590_067280 [Homalodisca vitripennis]|nr:hypothetical protein J6590_067280 [Homalodisca vitripennis]
MEEDQILVNLGANFSDEKRTGKERGSMSRGQVRRHQISDFERGSGGRNKGTRSVDLHAGVPPCRCPAFEASLVFDPDSPSFTRSISLPLHVTVTSRQELIDPVLSAPA